MGEKPSIRIKLASQDDAVQREYLVHVDTPFQAIVAEYASKVAADPRAVRLLYRAQWVTPDMTPEALGMTVRCRLFGLLTCMCPHITHAAAEAECTQGLLQDACCAALQECMQLHG
jgi:hypothetical protein